MNSSRFNFGEQRKISEAYHKMCEDGSAVDAAMKEFETAQKHKSIASYAKSKFEQGIDAYRKNPNTKLTPMYDQTMEFLSDATGACHSCATNNAASRNHRKIMQYADSHPGFFDDPKNVEFAKKQLDDLAKVEKHYAHVPHHKPDVGGAVGRAYDFSGAPKEGRAVAQMIGSQAIPNLPMYKNHMKMVDQKSAHTHESTERDVLKGLVLSESFKRVCEEEGLPEMEDTTNVGEVQPTAPVQTPQTAQTTDVGAAQTADATTATAAPTTANGAGTENGAAAGTTEVKTDATQSAEGGAAQTADAKTDGAEEKPTDGQTDGGKTDAEKKDGEGSEKSTDGQTEEKKDGEAASDGGDGKKDGGTEDGADASKETKPNAAPTTEEELKKAAESETPEQKEAREKQEAAADEERKAYEAKLEKEGKLEQLKQVQTLMSLDAMTGNKGFNNLGDYMGMFADPEFQKTHPKEYEWAKNRADQIVNGFANMNEEQQAQYAKAFPEQYEKLKNAMVQKAQGAFSIGDVFMGLLGNPIKSNGQVDVWSIVKWAGAIGIPLLLLLKLFS